MSHPETDSETIRNAVQNHYGKLAWITQSRGRVQDACCSTQMEVKGYRAEDLATVQTRLSVVRTAVEILQHWHL